MREALYYKPWKDGKVKCYLCPFECRIREGKIAKCLGRQNINGRLYAINYGETTSCSMDPIEKKPLFHFYPTTHILSIAANSCNLKCTFCQNASISQFTCSTSAIRPEDVLNLAIQSESIGVAYTYSEPLMWYEFILDTAKLIKKAHLQNVLVTNGTINEKPLRELLPYIDAFNVDLKGISEQFYKKQCKSLLKPVLNNIRIIQESQLALLEITNLIIPTLNDSHDDLERLTDWIAELDTTIPLHFSGYHPAHQLDIPATPVLTLEKAYHIAQKKLDYVYVGNAILEGASDTYCPKCKTSVIQRFGYLTKIKGVHGNRCQHCNNKLNIIQKSI